MKKMTLFAVLLLLCSIAANAQNADTLSQQHPDHFVNGAENLEDVPGPRKLSSLAPRRDYSVDAPFTFTQEHEQLKAESKRRRAARKKLFGDYKQTIIIESPIKS